MFIARHQVKIAAYSSQVLLMFNPFVLYWLPLSSQQPTSIPDKNPPHFVMNQIRQLQVFVSFEPQLES